MIEVIEQKIKDLYGSKASFCDLHGHKYKDFASKLRTFENRVNWLNEFVEPLGLEMQIAPKRKMSVVYLIRYGTYLDCGYIEKFASSEDSIKQLVKDDDLVMSGQGILDVNVDFDKCEINYTYKDWGDEIEEGKLYFDKVDVV